MIQLNERDKEWVLKAIELEMSKLQVIKKLEEANYKEDRIEAFIDYYDRIKESEKAPITEEKIKELKEDEKEFKETVRKYFEGNKDELSWGEKREVKKFLKNVTKYNEVLKVTLKAINMEIKEFSKKGFKGDKLEKELKNLRIEIIDRLIESKELLDIEHPITGEEITKENLSTLDLDTLLKIMEDNVETLDMIVNGKIIE